MYKLISLIILSFISISCMEQKNSLESNTNKLNGTWKLVYGEIRENDSIQIKNLKESNFIKIINNSHFAFFNLDKNNEEGFYGGAGTYTLDGDKYVEVLDYIKSKNIRGHSFPFTIEIKGDSLIQYGLEEIKEANIKRYIVEKYIKIEN